MHRWFCQGFRSFTTPLYRGASQNPNIEEALQSPYPEGLHAYIYTHLSVSFPTDMGDASQSHLYRWFFAKPSYRQASYKHAYTHFILFSDRYGSCFTKPPLRGVFAKPHTEEFQKSLIERGLCKAPKQSRLHKAFEASYIHIFQSFPNNVGMLH